MSNQSISLTPELYDYLLGVSLRESAVLRDLRARTAELPDSNMQIAPEQGQFMALLARLTGARRAIEVGVFSMTCRVHCAGELAASRNRATFGSSRRAFSWRNSSRV